jgi:hypothetical protein
MYQNLLPAVTVRWPKAPQAKAYQLMLSSTGREEKRLSLKAPRHTFASGELKEGTHSGHFEAIGPAVASKTITVQIQFDNAAPRASIKQPVSGSFVPGQEVTVEGVTEPGWRVFADSKEIESDSSHRFSGTVQTSAQYNGMALKLSHEQRGVHYYLRRGQKGSSR